LSLEQAGPEAIHTDMRQSPRIPARRARFLIVALTLSVAGCAREGSTGPSSLCHLPAEAAAAVGPEVYCAELVPVPTLRQVRAVLELNPGPSVFGAAVTAEGHAQYDPVITVAGLPPAESLGARAYVAWITTLAMGQPERLGTVVNGRNRLARVTRNQFRILVTPEPSDRPTSPSAPAVLRGASPSSKLLAHRDMIRFGATGFGRAADGHTHAGMGWTMPPMDPTMPAMPGIDELMPAVAPWLPPDSAPEVRPSQPVTLEDGDTLRLEAGFVRRRIGAHRVTLAGFNGEQPGPLVRVTEGATIIVAFHNALDQPSSVHWHGVRLDNRYDGAVGVTQDAVPPGGHFEYRVHFRDAGIYWYHPHVREDRQQDLGLYGNLLVRPAQAAAFAPADREAVVTLDDLLVGDGGLVPWGGEAPTHALMGRFGNVFLTNGEPHYRLDVRRGEVVRFYLTNVANSRIFNVSLGALPMKVVGADVGRFERETWVENVVLAPAERVIVDVRFPEAGNVALTNRIQAVSHMLGTYSSEVDTLGTIGVKDPPAAGEAGAQFQQLRENRDVIEEIDRYRERLDRPPDKRLVLQMDASRLSGALLSTMLVGYAPPVDWNDGMPMLNWLMTGREVRWTLQDPETGRENMDIDWRFRLGTVVKIAITNPAAAFHPMSHPIHLHGQRFLVASRNGVKSENLVWKDTVIVPVGETVELLLELSNPGRWMLHCHVAEHLGAGMMMTFRVDP
jgi:FtsP/CotA-like multicopper oxidase with cupredoxin domain